MRPPSVADAKKQKGAPSGRYAGSVLIRRDKPGYGLRELIQMSVTMRQRPSSVPNQVLSWAVSLSFSSAVSVARDRRR